LPVSSEGRAVGPGGGDMTLRIKRYVPKILDKFSGNL
jgi:hypothetical protein